MKRAWVLLALAACGKKHTSDVPEEPKPVTLIGCELALRPTADAIAVEDAATPMTPTPRPVPGPPAVADGGLVVELQPPKVAGGLDVPSVRKGLAKGHDAMAHCYESRLGSHPGIAGNVDLDFTVGPDGAVVSPSATGLDRALDQCLVRVLSTLTFKVPRVGGAKIRVAVLMHPAGDGVDEPVTDAPPVDEPPPPPESVLASLTWADDGADAGLVAWTHDHAATSVAAIDLSACALGATGTARARLGVDRTGAVVDVEVTGVGSEAVEACLAHGLAGATMSSPPTAAALQCDLAVGGPGPARVTIRAGEPVIDVDTDARIAGTPYDLGALGAALATTQADGKLPITVRVTGQTNVTFLAAVLAVLDGRKDDYVVGVEDGAGGLALISDRVTRGAGPPRATMGPRPRLALAGGRLIATVPGRGVLATAALGDAVAERAVIDAIAGCGECERIVELGAAPGTEARWLTEVAAWSSLAGLPRLVLVTL